MQKLQTITNAFNKHIYPHLTRENIKKVVIKLAIPGIIFIILWLLLFTNRLFELHAEAKLENDKEQQQAQKAKTETQLLFEALMAQKQLITIAPDGKIKLPPKDYALAKKVNKQAISEAEDSLLDRLYHSIAGKALQKQVELWNHSRNFAAVRDNKKRPDGETTSSWEAWNEWGEKLDGSDFVPLNYGYINGGELRPNFNDWMSASNNDGMVFKTSYNLGKSGTIDLQIIGKPDISQLPGKVKLSACYPLTAAQKRRGQTPSCKQTPVATDAEAYEIHLTLAAGKHDISLPIIPATNQEKRISGLSIALDENNKYIWIDLRQYAKNIVQDEEKSYRYVIKTQDGKALSQLMDGKPTKYTEDNGLISLIGYDNRDRYALSGLLAQSNLPHDKTEMHLTIDSRVQTIAQKHLEKEVEKQAKDELFTQRRRAAVVIMNPNTGEIIAAANVANLKKGVHPWDRLSFAQLYPNRDPFGINSWQGLDNNNAPGSTFKTVTALAALQAADEGRDDIKHMIKGLSPNELKRLTGLSITDYSYQPDPKLTTEVKNAGNTVLLGSIPHKASDGKSTIRPRLRKAGGSGCPTNSVTSTKLGMKEAVRDSLNIWFARLGIMMDADLIDSGGMDTHLASMSRLLGFGKVYSLSPDNIPLRRIHGGAGRGDVLNYFAGSLSLDDTRLIKREQSLLAQGLVENPTSLQRLTQNTFGQGVTTTPLQMARIAASIATEKIPQPYLIAKWDGKKTATPDRRRLRINDIEYLREGMKAVPEAGTAATAFNKNYPQGQCRTFGKTGTAQLGIQIGNKSKRANFNTGWFVGWHEDKNGKPDYSFACMVTHVKKDGGKVCGPIMARILNDINQPASNNGAKP